MSFLDEDELLFTKEDIAELPDSPYGNLKDALYEHATDATKSMIVKCRYTDNASDRAGCVGSRYKYTCPACGSSTAGFEDTTYEGCDSDGSLTIWELMCKSCGSTIYECGIGDAIALTPSIYVLREGDII